MKLPFLRFFDNPLSKYLTFKIISCNGCFGLCIKIIERPGTSFICTFSAWFFYKNIPYLILHLWTRFQYHTFFLLKISNKIAIEFLFRQLMISWTLRFIFYHPPKQWPTGRKRGKDRNTKNSNISRTKRAF